MTDKHLDQLVARFLDAWTSQDVENVLACYTEDLRYCDPNTRGTVVGRDAMRRYLTKLFAAWNMTWARREVFELKHAPGVSFLWHATFRRHGGSQLVEADGMDLVILRGDRAERNEVYFDRTALLALMSAE